MNDENFIDFQTAADFLINTITLQVSKVTKIKISHKKPGVVEIKDTLTDLEPWRKINVSMKDK